MTTLSNIIAKAKKCKKQSDPDNTKKKTNRTHQRKSRKDRKPTSEKCTERLKYSVGDTDKKKTYKMVQ
jgi:hypothetical protein